MANKGKRGAGSEQQAAAESEPVVFELRNLTAKIDLMNDSFRGELINQVERLETAIENIKCDVLTELVKQGQELRSHVDAEVGRLESRIVKLEQRTVSRAPFDPDVSVVIAGLQEDTAEDLHRKVVHLLSRGLGCDTVPTAVERIDGRGRGPGLVKAEFNTVQEKIDILRRKQQLREHREYNRVFIRSARSHSDRIVERNFKTLLNDLPGGSQFYVAGNGVLRRRDTAPEQRGEKRRQSERSDQNPTGRYGANGGNK